MVIILLWRREAIFQFTWHFCIFYYIYTSLRGLYYLYYYGYYYLSGETEARGGK